MSENTKVERPQNRIIYVEPNDIYGHVNDIPVTPDYTDYCISFDLIVEVVSRMKSNNYAISYEQKDTDDEDNGTKEYVISWRSLYNTNSDDKKAFEEVSFMSGEKVKTDGNEKSYLTTFYTDTHYNDFKNKTIVEGLGVESVNISFESYYAPTVKIRFIDVRGSSLFGREEVLHTDEVLAEDNIWGCFFTFPYPKYKLQVKGFYGKAVTFHLCCTDFRANFNSQTGNYEIDMSFLGYDFGVLADIPMQYLIAAPYCDYSDVSAYWRKHQANDPAWRMSDGGEVKTFKDIKEKIAAAIETYGQNTSEEVLTEDIEVSIVDYERKAVLDQMEEHIIPIETYFKSKQMVSFGGNDNETNLGFGESKQSVQIGKGTTPVIAKFGVIGGDRGFREDISGTTKANEQNKEDGFKKHVTELNELWKLYKERWSETELAKVSIMLVQDNANTSFSGTRLIVDPTTGQIKTLYGSNYNEGVPMTFEERLERDFHLFREAFNKDYETLESIAYQTRSLDTTSGGYNGKQKIQELVGFIPNIGNVFRTLYCHLETFTHMIYRCAKNINAQIENGDRTYDKMGIPVQNTDIDNTNNASNNVIPFPTVYTYKQQSVDDDEDNTADDKVAVDAWVGEIRNPKTPWEEKILIDNLFKAVLKVAKDSNETRQLLNSMTFPVLPCDLNNDGIAGVALDLDPGKLAGYLAIRAAALFGIAGYTDYEAEDAGKMDALNYYEKHLMKEDIIEGVFKKLGNGSKADILYDISLCKGEYATAEKPLPFEVAERVKGANPSRHPFFIEKSGTLRYCYTEDKNSNAFVPIRLSSWRDTLDTILDYEVDDNGSHFNFKTINNHSDILYKQYSEELLKDSDLTDDDRKAYTNDEIFTIYYGGNYSDGSSVSEKVQEIHNNLKDGAININGYTKDSDGNRFSKILKRWKNIDNESFEKTYYQHIQSLYPSLEMLGVDKTKIGFDEDGNMNNGTANNPRWYVDTIVNKNVVLKNGELKYDYKTVDKSQCFTLVPELRVYENNIQPSILNVFTSSYYYMQNDNYIRFADVKEFPYSTREMAAEGMKALLFLLTMDYKADAMTYYLKKNTTASIEQIPLPILLFHGALLWRKRFYEINGRDPIVYKSTADGLQYNVSFKEIAEDEIPIVGFENGMNRGLITANSELSYRKFDSMFGDTDLDDAITNKLIEIFRDFVKSDEWKEIKKNCELKPLSGEYLTYSKFSNLVHAGQNFNEVLKSDYGSEYRSQYIYFAASKGRHGLISILSEENEANEIIKNLYLSKITVQRTTAKFDKRDTSITIQSSTYKKYITSFVKQLEDMCNANDVSSQSNEDVDDESGNTDIKRLMYMFIKNLWDRWFCGSKESDFTCEKYMGNTIFIDSMYRNVYTRIHVNCEILLDLLRENDGKSMVFKFLSDLTTKHHCMFFGLPDYINWDADGISTEKGMEDMFTPMPYSKINEIETMNRYIVMFTHKPSEINDTRNGYKYDSFDIYSHDDKKKEILPTFSKECVGSANKDDKHSMECSRYGYNVPAFGVEFGRQNNAIFKKINVGMQNPVQTEQSINALSMIAERGRGKEERMIFYGQDLYNVFSGYSYTATVEMMGNAQIMPLMYFQLFNIPMFRGAYMIYGVTHTMRPGDMTTTVKAMKMSKFALPWCKEWYSHYYFDDDGTIHEVGDDECGTAIDIPINVDYTKDIVFKVVRDKFGDTYTNGKLYVDDKLLCHTLERNDPGYDNSDSNIKSEAASSKGREAIQTGTYRLTRFHRQDKTHNYYCALINGVIGRDGILIHDGTKPSDSNGCLLVGDKGTDGTLKYNKNMMFQISEIIRVANNNNKKCTIIFSRTT